MTNTTTPADLAKKLGWQIRRKRDGTFQLVRRTDDAKSFEPMTMAGVEKTLATLRTFREQGVTFSTACGIPLYTVPPAKPRKASKS